MNKQAKLLYVIGTAVLFLILTAFGLRFGLGYLLGSIASLAVYGNTVRFADASIRAGMPSGGALHFILNFAIWTAVLLTGAFLPGWFNILTCALGLFMIRIVLIIDELLRRKGR